MRAAPRSPRIAAGHGRRWTAWPTATRATFVALGRRLAAADEREPQAADVGAEVGEQRRQQRDAATITTSTASEAAIATPYMYGRPVSARPSTAITTVAPASTTLRPAVTASRIESAVLLCVHRGAEAGQHEQA